MPSFRSAVLWFIAWLTSMNCPIGGVLGDVQPAIPVELAVDGQALHAIVTGAEPTERTRLAASTLADYLSRITGATFAVHRGDGRRGIAVGLPGDFPNLSLAERWTNPQPTQREDYLLRTHTDGVFLLGATESAVEHAVWDFLYRLGYRQFFPGDVWKVVPTAGDLSVALDEQESPDYHARRIWYGFGTWDYNSEPYRQWCARNRATSGISLQSGHAYGRIIRALKEDFERHPEYYALVDGQRDVRGEAKLCISNAELRARIAAYAVERFEQDPSQDSISMDPSDGGGWCQCEHCRAVGSVSDRVVLLANDVAACVNERFPGKWVGMYAYNYHSPPPEIRPHPRVVVSIATAFLKGGMSLDEIIDGWSRLGTKLGIREYYSVNTWDRDMPGETRGGNLDYLARTIPSFHRRGVRFMSAESSDNWGPNGLGYYLAARMLWDVDEAQRIDELVDDFLTRAFGPAAEPMAEFYQQVDGSHSHLVFDDQLGRMFRSLRKARSLADTPSIHQRLDDLTLYAHYVDLYRRYVMSEDQVRQEAFEQLIRHAYRMRSTMLVHTKALYRDLVQRDKSVTIPAGAEWNVPEAANPWKSSQPFSAAELTAFVEDGMRRYQLTDLQFEPVAFSQDLVPASPLQLADRDLGQLGPGRHDQAFYSYVRKAPTTLELQITGGLISHYRDRGNVRVQVWKLGGTSRSGQRETLVATDRSVPPDGVRRTVRIRVDEEGLYKLLISDGGDRTEVSWPDGQPMTIASSVQSPMNSHHTSWMMVFYVPQGTRVVGLHGGGHGEVRDGEDRPVFWLNGREPNFYAVPVPEGQDGRLWQIRYGRGPIRLLTVPPYFARRADELLLPREVVESAGR